MPFAPVTLSPGQDRLRAEVREFLASELPRGSYRPGLGMNAEASPEFSRRLAARGWVGMTIPAAHGGHGLGPVERFIVVEELLAAGAPVGAHWIADRQTGPTILAYGTEEQKRRFLPAIARGECYFSLGMSEPDAGSDLAAVRTAATRVPGGWSLTGSKIWTSGAHRNHYFAVLCRTSPLGHDRHEGLSQLLVDLSAPGLTVSPIPLLDGSHHFNQVVFDEVFVADDMVLGEVGSGWHQVTSELSYERSGPDRFLSSWPLLETFVREHGSDPVPGLAATIGKLTARFWAIRQLSLSVARALEAGAGRPVEAAMVKDLGTVFEQEVAAVLHEVLGYDPLPRASSLFESLLAQALLVAPSYTIRGGTTEVLRTIAARALGSSR